MNIEVPPGVRYTCSQCGECCRRYSILLGPGEKERIEGLDWTGKRPDLVGVAATETLRDPGFSGRVRLARREADTCLFLGENNQCLIHKHFGEAAKPLICRLYPFAFIPLGDRLCLDVSFLCRAVNQEIGAPVGEENVPEWTRLIGESPPLVDRTPHRVRRNGPILSGALLWEIEHFLLAFLRDRSMTLFDRIRCVIQFIEVATTGNPNSPTAAEFRQAMARGVAKQVRERLPPPGPMDPTQQALFAHWLFQALNPVPSSYHELSPGDRKRERDLRLELATSLRERRGRPRIDNRDLSCGFKDVDRVDPGLFNKKDFVLPETYLCAKIVGQRFLQFAGGEEPLFEGTRRFLLAFPMMIWTSKALAADAGRSAVEPPDVRRAIYILDRFASLMPVISLPPKLTEAWDFILNETPFVASATRDAMGGGGG